jgi:hypothetical protein
MSVVFRNRLSHQELLELPRAYVDSLMAANIKRNEEEERMRSKAPRGGGLVPGPASNFEMEDLFSGML